MKDKNNYYKYLIFSLLINIIIFMNSYFFDFLISFFWIYILKIITCFCITVNYLYIKMFYLFSAILYFLFLHKTLYDL